MEGTTVGQSISEAVPASTTVTDVSVPSGAWQALTREVRQSWDSYGETLAAAERSKNEAHGFLLEIGKRLSEAKERLARPGRSGGWSSFTRSAGLSRAEADGLVRRYRRTLVPEANCGEKAIAGIHPHPRRAPRRRGRRPPGGGGGGGGFRPGNWPGVAASRASVRNCGGADGRDSRRSHTGRAGRSRCRSGRRCAVAQAPPGDWLAASIRRRWPFQLARMRYQPPRGRTRRPGRAPASLRQASRPTSSSSRPAGAPVRTCSLG